MRPRRWFTTLAMLSLAMCVLFCVLLIRSGFRRDLIITARDGVCLTFDTDYDSLWVHRYHGWPTTEPLRWLSAPSDDPLGPRLHSHQSAPGRYEVGLNKTGRVILFGERDEPLTWSPPMRRETVYWLRFTNWIALCLPLPLIWTGLTVRQWTRTRRRRGAGQCVACGYDLRGTPERCPECGNSAG